MLPGRRDNIGRVFTIVGSPPAGSPYLQGLPLSHIGQQYIDTGTPVDPSKTLDINFLNSGPLDSKITFTRTTTATYLNNLGVLATAAINAPRFEYNGSGQPLGLLIEGARTNVVVQSSALANAIWVPAVGGFVQTANAAVSPSGATDAAKYVASVSNGAQEAGQVVTVTAAAWTASVYAKKGEYNFAYLQFYDGVSDKQAWFDLNAGTVGTANNCTSSITPVGNGWYRCVTYMTPTATTNNFRVGVSNANGVRSYSGDGTSGIYVWGGQMEEASSASSYIPTTTAAATRAADNASMTGTNFSSWYNAAVGTWGAQYRRSTGNTENADLRVISDLTSNPAPISSTLVAASYWDGANYMSSGAANQFASCKAATRYGGGQAAITANGLALTSGSSNNFSGMVGIRLGSQSGNQTILFGHIQRLTYWNRALTDQEMINWTTLAITHIFPTEPTTDALLVSVGGTPASWNMGLPFTAGGRLIGTLDATPLVDDPYLAGVRVSPTTGVYFSTAAPPP